MLPIDFEQRMKELLQDEYEAFITGYEKAGTPSLRVNPGKGRVEDLTERSGWELKQVPWSPLGFYYQEEVRPGKHPYHEAGAYYIQEASAMTPGVLLDAQPGEYVLDLCGAPGGKSTQIGCAMKGEGILICNEIHPARAKILSENVERMGLKNAIVTSENPVHMKDFFPEYFDRIMVDAPCSGEGMFRKHPEAMDEWSLANVQICADRQDEILDCAAQMLAPGGRMVYSTCTFAPAEDEGSVARFLQRHPEFQLLDAHAIIKELAPEAETGLSKGRPQWAEPELMEAENTIRLWPHLLDGEGHFAAVLQKEGEQTSHEYRSKVIGQEKGLKEKAVSDWLEFEKESMSEKLEGTMIKFKDQLYLLPTMAPSLKGLKVIRPGLHLGTSLKNRFEPSHALALASDETQMKKVCNINLNMAKAFINGQTFNWEGDKGWYLIQVDGYSLGWGKLAGGIMKNHYPKGLRKQV